MSKARSVLPSVCLLVSLAGGVAAQDVPSNGHIVWASNRQDARHEIYLMNADGSGVSRLTYTSGGAKRAGWAPDGRWVSYNDLAGNTTRVMRWDTSEDKQIFNGPSVFWMRDNSGIVCQANGTDDYYLVDPDTGSSSFSFRKSDFSQIGSLVFAPSGLTWNGRWLLITTDRFNGGYTCDNGSFNSYWSAVLLDMNDKSKLYFFGPGCEPSAAYSGDMVYHCYGGGWPNVDIYHMNVNDVSTRGSYAPEVDFPEGDWGHEYFPRVSTDGVWLTYGASVDESQHDHDTGQYEVCVHRLGAGSRARAIVTNDASNDQWPHMYVGDLWQPPAQSVTIDSFAATPATIPQGQSSTLTWATSNATSVTLDGAAVGEDGSTEVWPSATTTYTLVAEGDSGPVQRQVTVNVGQPPEVSVPFKMNCGSGDPYVSGWEDDDAYVSGGGDHTFAAAPDTTGVRNAAPADVYITCRHAEPTFAVPVADGTYDVRLHFYDEFGGRDITVTIEGQVVLDDFDIMTESGSGMALVKEFASCAVVDGSLDIAFLKDTGNDAFVSGIEILTSGSSGPSITIESPVGGEVWYVGTTPSIRWSAVGVQNVAITYWSGFNGNWQSVVTTLTSAEAGWGDYPWTVPDAPAADCRVSISDYLGAAQAESPGVFVISAVDDSDGDGMDDGWEQEHFDGTGRDGTGDFDGDGQTDYEEFMSGTDPTSVQSSGGDRTGFSCAPGDAGASLAGLATLVFLVLAGGLAARKRADASRAA